MTSEHDYGLNARNVNYVNLTNINDKAQIITISVSISPSSICGTICKPIFSYCVKQFVNKFPFNVSIQTTISIIIRIDYYISSNAANLHTQELLQVSSAILNDVISHNETKSNSQKTSSEKRHFIQPCVCWWPDTVRYQGICRHSDDYTKHGFKTSESDKIPSLIVHCQKIHSQKCATTALVWPEPLQVSSGIIVNTEINQQHL